MPATLTSIMNSVQSGIRGLALDGINPDNVVIGKVPTDRKGLLPALPGILIAPYGNTTIIGGTNLRDDVSYPILIAMLQAGNTSQTENRDRALQWSESIARKFRKQRLEGVADVYACQIVSDVKFDSTFLFTANIDVNVIQLQFLNREARG